MLKGYYASRSSSLKHFSNVIWEVLNKARNVNEKLAWEDEAPSEDDVFFMPPENPIKEDINDSVMSNSKTHLEVNGVVHACIVKQLIGLDIVNPLGFLAPKLSKSKQQWKCTKVIKIVDRKAPPKPPKVDRVQRKIRNVPHIVDSD
jgi:hypothetical protein